MIYITGDTHGNMDLSKISNTNWKEAKNLTEKDYLIICGDFGFPFLPTDYSEEYPTGASERSSRAAYEYWMSWLSGRRYTVLWIDGNHDNHKFWYSQPVSEWHGGLVNFHPEARNVIHLKRGEYYNIDGYTFWTMGGAKSHDRLSRIPGISWWQEEIPSQFEMEYGLHKLEQHNNKVDFIITHTLPSDLQFSICKCFYTSEPTGIYLNEVYRRTDFKYWFCGHYHENIDSKMCRVRVLYDDIVPLSEYTKNL
ncbi:MAG: metallophosphoesterase [Ruminococcus sp.]|nr:metallophosphoesterase [Ruminococcus sp.]